MTAAAAGAVPGGRAAVRGGGGNGVRPGADVSGAVRGMEGLGLERRGGQATRRRGALLYIPEPHTRPSHITDKRGEYDIRHLLPTVFYCSVQPIYRVWPKNDPTPKYDYVVTPGNFSAKFCTLV